MKKYKIKKDKGSAEVLLHFMPFLFILPIIAIILNLLIVTARKEQLQDEIVTSSLAAALIDLQEYGINGEIVISDTDKSFLIFKECLKNNMKLNADFTPKDNSFFTGPIKIKDYIIYNVKNDKILSVNKVSGVTQEKPLGTVNAPNGDPVTKTSIYVKLEFPFALFMNMSFNGWIDNLVAVVN